jgi:hypothetical protein
MNFIINKISLSLTLTFLLISYADAQKHTKELIDTRPIFNIAILFDTTYLPDKPAIILSQNQFDFNYLDIRSLKKDARINATGIYIAGMVYQIVIIDSLIILPSGTRPMFKKLAKNHHLIINAELKYASWFNGTYVYYSYDDLLNAIKKINDAEIIPAASSE